MRILKWLGIALGSLVGILVIAAAVLHFVGNSRFNDAPDVTVQMVDIPTDEVSIARGKHLATISSCGGCHQSDYRGDILIEGPPIGTIPAPNLTSGQGGIGTMYTDEDWIRAIRHGIGSDGRTLGMMPSQWYTYMSDEDLGDLIAYMKTVSPVDHPLPERTLVFPGTIIFGVLGYASFPANIIEHDATRPASVIPSSSADYGQYLSHVAACNECHGARLAGLLGENGPPPGPNLTPAGNLSRWSQEDFTTALRTGQTPEGKSLDPEMMPWPKYNSMTDEEVTALWNYLSSLEARGLGEN